METAKELQRIELLNYTKANGDELVGLAVELMEDPNGGVQVRVLMDSNVVSGVTGFLSSRVVAVIKKKSFLSHPHCSRNS